MNINSLINKTVVLADGELPDKRELYEVMRSAIFFVCCDGAINDLCLETDIKPHVIVGDCDSIYEHYKEKFANRIYHIADQETNDLTKAVHFCVEKGYKDIVILGATGKREDHTLGNISLLAEYINIEGINICMATDYGIFTAIKKTTIFESYKTQQVSVFDVGRTPTTFHGPKYPVENRILDNWWQGTLNEALADSFTIETCGKMIVFRAW